MDSVITFIGENISSCLSGITAELKERKLELGAPLWLADNYALDIPFNGLTPDMATSLAKELLTGRKIDAYAQPQGNRRKRILICDMDSTMITSETMDDIAAASPYRNEIMAITQQSIRGEIDFAEGLRRRVKLLHGLNGAIFESVRATIEFSKGASILVKTMRSYGALTSLVSGGFSYFAKDVGNRLGFERVYANDLPVLNGEVAHAVVEPILDSAAKSEILMDIAKEKNLCAEDAAAIGDGSNDIAMLKVAGLGCAYRGKPLVRKAISCQLNHADLTGLLYYQGYRKDEFCMG